MERIEAHLAIQQLAIRYAMAVDARDMEAWVRCFRPDVDMGRHGTGRDALRRYIDPMVRRFYRSVHQICGHRIELTTKDTATGAVYCRAEHEAGQEWIVIREVGSPGTRHAPANRWHPIAGSEQERGDALQKAPDHPRRRRATDRVPRAGSLRRSTGGASAMKFGLPKNQVPSAG